MNYWTGRIKVVCEDMMCLAVNSTTLEADICDRSEPVMLTQEAIDAIWEAQFKKYGQMCDSEDWNMFAASIEAASLRANGLKAPSI